MKKVVLVTGASSGIGYKLCLDLIERGYEVYGAARRIDLMKPIEDKGGHRIFLDVTDSSSIEKCVSQILTEQKSIDVLVNNAGYGAGGSLEEVSIEEARRQFDVNIFGLMELTKKVLPVMRNNKSGRIINVSSVAGHFSSPFLGWYHATKFSLEALSDALRFETAPFGIKVVVVDPGMIRTDWGVIAADSMRSVSANGPYSVHADKVARFYEKRYKGNVKISKPEVISNCIRKIIQKKNPRIRYKAGTGSKFLIGIKKILPDGLFNFIEKIVFNCL